MRFSLKWMFALVTWAALYCAAVIYANHAWMLAWQAATGAALALAVTAAFVARGGARAFAIGAAVVMGLVFADVRFHEDAEPLRETAILVVQSGFGVKPPVQVNSFVAWQPVAPMPAPTQVVIPSAGANQATFTMQVAPDTSATVTSAPTFTQTVTPPQPATAILAPAPSPPSAAVRAAPAVDLRFQYAVPTTAANLTLLLALVGGCGGSWLHRKQASVSEPPVVPAAA